MGRPRASVVIVSWNAARVLDACLASVATQELEGGFETVVLDNGSTDETHAVLAKHAGHIRTLRNEENKRYAAANNQAAAEASGDVLLFLNNDTEMHGSDTLATIVEAVERPGVGVVGPRLVNPDGTLQPSCAPFPGVGRALLTAAGLVRLLPDRARRRSAADHWSHDAAADVDWIMGAAIAVPAELFRRLGGFWPTMYGEDEDLAYRVRRLGLRVRYEPAAEVMHIGRFSSGQRWAAPERAAIVARAEATFLRTHYAPARAAAIRSIRAGGYAARVVAYALLGRRDAVALYRAMARAILAPEAN
ncbi:MAG TPA: glycosyltransferase [Solirubrobacteraceae bacterium]|jgi:hypothetical protein